MAPAFYARPTIVPGSWTWIDAVGDSVTVQVYPRGDAERAPNAPIMCVVPGSAGEEKYPVAKYRTPVESMWLVHLDMGGKSVAQGNSSSAWRRVLPNEVLRVAKHLRGWASAAGSVRRLIYSGYSRGACWGLRIAYLHPHIFDGFLLLAPYPTNYNECENEDEAYQTLTVQTPMVFLNFKDDTLCGEARFKQWYKIFRTAVQCDPGTERGRRGPCFNWFQVSHKQIRSYLILN